MAGAEERCRRFAGTKQITLLGDRSTWV